MSSITTLDRDSVQDRGTVLYGPPFDYARADLAVRASDDTLFFVPKMSLEMASPILRERILSLEEESDNSCGSVLAGKRPVLEVAYPSSIVAHLLSTIVPVDLELPDDFERVALLLTATEKLEMKASAISVRRTPVLERLLRSDPINSYCIACRVGLSEETRRAAEYSLGNSLRLQDLPFAGDLIYMLHVFHQTWAQQSRTLADALTEKYAKTCIFSHEHAVEASSMRCSHKRSGWLDALRAAFTEALNHPLMMNRTLICLHLTAPMGPTLFTSLLSPDYKNLDFNKLDDISSDVETSAKQSLASIELRDVPDPFSLAFRDTLPSESKEEYHTMHDRADADVTLRSSDGVSFRTYKAILSMSSSFFQDMFSLPIAAGDDDHTLRVVQMSESATTLESLLSILLPMRATIPSTFLDYALVLAAAQKFDMEYAMEMLRTGASTSLKMSSACKRYGIACRLHLRDEAVSAAKELLDFPMTIEQYAQDLRYLGAHALQLLLEYRKSCQRRLLPNEDTLHVLLWQALGSPSDIGCKAKDTRTNRSVPDWVSLLSKGRTVSDNIGLERSLSPWTLRYFESIIASHGTLKTSPPSPPCTHCMSLSPGKLYDKMNQLCRELVVRAVSKHNSLILS